MSTNKHIEQTINKKSDQKDKFDNFKQIIRGGQVFLHNLRMIGQVLNKVMLWTLPISLLFSIVWFLETTEKYDRYLGYQYVTAEINSLLFDDSHQQKIIDPEGNTIEGTAKQIIYSGAVSASLTKLISHIERSLAIGLVFYLLNIFIVLWWLKRQGEENSKSRYIKGDYLSNIKEIQKMLKEKKLLSDRIIGTEKLPLPAYSEMQHYLFHDTTGSGKSTSIKEFLDFIRTRGERAIVYCKGGSFVKQFFIPNNDILLNPLDKRGEDWNMWGECRDKTDFENLAAAMIPLAASGQDPFWNNAARTIFAASAYRMQRKIQEDKKDEKNNEDSQNNKKEEMPKVLSLLRYLLTADIQELQDLLKGTEAETLMSEKTEKTAISIKSILATYLKSLCYIKDGNNPFSIRNWVRNDDTDDNHKWLFISSLGDKHESLKPLITAWLDIAVNALLSLPEDPNRRIWVILDELTSLQQLPYLSAALSESRKFGGCMIIGIQSYAQLAKLYGSDGAREISSLLNTRFMFRVPDPDIAAWSSKNLGEITIEEVREGISYGANTMRDGVSVNRVEKERPVVSGSEIMRMKDLSCFVRLPGDYPIVNLTFEYVERHSPNLAFDQRDFQMDDFREVIKLAEKHQDTTDRSANSTQKFEKTINQDENNMKTNNVNQQESVTKKTDEKSETDNEVGNGDQKIKEDTKNNDQPVHFFG